MASSLKAPPLFTDEITYGDWKNDLEIWQSFTDLDKKKQGPALYLTLTEKAKTCIRGLTAKDLAVDNGVKLILDKLDPIFR